MEIVNNKIKKALYGLMIVSMVGGVSACDNNRGNDMSRATDTEAVGDRDLDNDAETVEMDENAWMRERDRFIATNREIESRIDKEIAERERDMEKLGNKSKAAMKESINSLKIKRNKLDTKLNNLGEASQEAWQDMKNEVSEASTELEKSWEAFEKVEQYLKIYGSK